MSKPSWADAPDWANYLAMDSDGEWHWFDERPRPESYSWGRSFARRKFAGKSLNWRQTLEEKPKEKS
jgi:hypothetical protein